MEQTPSLGRIVHVTTQGEIGGQTTHVAIITKVHEDGAVDVTMFPAENMPLAMVGLRSDKGMPRWLWPPHVPPSAPKGKKAD